MPLYVTMRDKFMSGWGAAEGKEAVLIIECPDRDAAGRAYYHGHYSKEMEEVRITEHIPTKYLNEERFYRSDKKYEDLGPVWKLTESEQIMHKKKIGELP